METVKEIIHWGSIAIPVIIALWQYIRKNGYKKTLQAVISGIDIAVGNKADINTTKGIIQAVSERAGVKKHLDKEIHRLRGKRYKKEKKLGISLGLDAKGRPTAGLKFDIDF